MSRIMQKGRATVFRTAVCCRKTQRICSLRVGQSVQTAEMMGSARVMPCCFITGMRRSRGGAGGAERVYRARGRGEETAKNAQEAGRIFAELRIRKRRVIARLFYLAAVYVCRIDRGYRRKKRGRIYITL